MEGLWRRLGYAVGRRWYLVVGGSIVLTLVLSIGLQQLDFATGQDSYLNSDSQIAIDNREFQENFGGETLILLFEATDGGDVSTIVSGDNLAEFERLESELRAVPGVYSVITPLTSLQLSAGVATEGVGTSALSSAAERDPDADSQALRQEDIQTSLARLTQIDEQDFTNDAWTEFLLFANDGYTVDGDTITAPEGDERAIRSSLLSTFPNLQTAVGGVILEGNADLDALSSGTDAVLEIMETADLEGFDITVTGSPVFLKDINDYLKSGMLVLGAIAILIMGLILGLMFRVKWRFLALASTVIGVLWGFSLLGFIDVDLSLVTISGLPILIGLGIDFAIQVHNRVEEETALDHDEHPISETLANLAPAMLAATMAGVVAFLALQISQVPMLRDFGVMLAIGITVLVFCAIILVSSALGVREYRARTLDRPDSIVERIVVRLGSLPTKASPYLAIASAVLFVAGIAMEGSFTIESDPVKWIDQSSQTVKDLQQLEESTGFESTLGVLVQANNVLDQDVDDVLFGFISDAEDRPEVASSSSLVTTMSKFIEVPGATLLPPTSDDVAGLAEILPEDIALALLRPDDTATQVNLRLAPASLDERAVLVEELTADLDRRIDEMDLPEDSILLVDLDEGEPPIRAVPSGLAVVGTGLLENLEANRATLTYFGLALASLVLLLRFRSFARALFTLVPVGLAIGASSVIIAVFDLTLSPLTTVSGPLVIAACTEFSVLIMARFLEERQRGLEPLESAEHAARRTGRAFFTSACTTTAGFAVLIASSLPLLRDFGIIVTLNVAIAVLAALVVMPPLMVWADERGMLPFGDVTPEQSVVLAAEPKGRRLVYWIASIVVVSGAAIALYATAERGSGEAVEVSYVSTPLPTTTTTTTEPVDASDIDPADFPAEPPTGLVPSTVFRLLTAQGADPQAANCTHTVLLSENTEDEIVGLVSSDQDALFELVAAAATTCGIPQDVIDAAIAAGL